MARHANIPFSVAQYISQYKSQEQQYHRPALIILGLLFVKMLRLGLFSQEGRGDSR